MDINLACAVCGQDLCIEGVTEVIQAHGVIHTWREAHKHSDLELKMYHDSEVAVRQYQHSNPFAGNED